jgi:hypothetical protein
VWEDGWRTVEGEQAVEAGRSSADLRLSATVKI